MNKKILSSCLVLSVCLAAAAPVYKSLSFNRDILAPATMQQSYAPTTQDLKLSDAEILRAEQLKIRKNMTLEKNLPQPAAETAVKAVNSKISSTQKKPVVKKTISVTAKKSTSTVSKTTTRKTTAKSTTTVKKATTYRASTLSSRGTTAVSSKASAIISTAKSYLGVPYAWGGTSPSGFDCSGFTQYVLAKNGINVPRTSADQYKIGVSVSKSNLEVGDLVFFTTYKPGPSHVGFYIGDGKFISASSSNGVSISSLSNSYWSPRYIGARRII